MRLRPSFLRARLLASHLYRVDRIRKRSSPLSHEPFPGEFNGGGFEREILDLVDCPSSFWGIDRCLRIAERIDAYHSHVFHMGVFARSIELGGDFRDPWTDPRFHQLQLSVLDQFFSVLAGLGIRPNRLEASYFGGMRLADRGYRLPPDRNSMVFLRRRAIRSFPVPSIANFHIGPDGGLAGPRVEVACDGVEIGNVLFACFRRRRRTLQPSNYLSTYALGLERLLSVLDRSDFLHSLGRHVECRKLVEKKVRAARFTLFERDVLSLLFGAEALASVPDDISNRQRQSLRRMVSNLRRSMNRLGLSARDVAEIVAFYRRWRD
jgi:hypothetical protein